jgi:large subunit ribosomal protein L1
VKKPSKRFAEALKKVDATKSYSSDDAIKLAKEIKTTKFDETVDLAFRLGVDPRHADQMIRGALALPAGTGKKVRIVVITSGNKVDEATAAGADLAGGEDVINKIAGGWLEFDRVIASPDMMSKLGKVARLLGPRGLMPNPKLGTVTVDIAGAVKEQKSGKVEYRTEKNGIIHVPMGKSSFTGEQLKQNYTAIMNAIVKAKPASAKGTYVKSITLSTTMGPGIKIDATEATATTSLA